METIIPKTYRGRLRNGAWRRYCHPWHRVANSILSTDPLVGDAEANGWVTFWCQSKIGLQYNIGTTGLDPLSKYSVHAFGIQAVVVDPYTPGAIDTGEGFWIQIVDSVNLNLGTFRTDANGLGGVKGVAKLPAGYSYNVGTVVSNSDNVPVLWSPSDDPNGFLVY